MMVSENQWGRVERRLCEGGLERLLLTHKTCAAEISLYGGQVLHWQPTNEAPVFWLSKSSRFEKGQAIRGGIPICWPWFGSLAQEVNHGFARLSDWDIADVEITQEAIQVTLVLEGKELSAQWPHAFRLLQHLRFGKAFEQSLEIVNLGAEPISFTGAMHSYFSVSHPKNTELPALAGVVYKDKLQGFNEFTINEPVLFDKAIDRVYKNSAPVDLYDSELQRKISISKDHSAQWVVWNPGSEAAKRVNDIHREGELEYVCVEVANTDPVSVEANSSFVFSQRITIAPL